MKITKTFYFSFLLFLFFTSAFSQAVYNGSSKHKFTTNYGNIEIGPFNGSWAHIYTNMPNIIFNKDVYTTTNAYSSYNNDLILKTRGTERFRINDVNGNVGIGVTNPSEKLHINGSIKGNIGGGALRIKSDSGYIDVGAQNTSYAHIYTDRPKVIFNKDVYTMTNSFSSYNNDLVLKTEGNIRLTINDDTGNVGIGTTNPDAKLAVNGKIHAKEVKVDLVGWSDFVFYDDYKLPTLEEVAAHIKEKGHLKDIPSAKEVAKNGIYLGEMDAKLLQKIEELTLYVIDLKEENMQQQKEILKLKNQEQRLITIEEKLKTLTKN